MVRTILSTAFCLPSSIRKTKKKKKKTNTKSYAAILLSKKGGENSKREQNPETADFVLNNHCIHF